MLKSKTEKLTEAVLLYSTSCLIMGTGKDQNSCTNVSKYEQHVSTYFKNGLPLIYQELSTKVTNDHEKLGIIL